ncbi:serine hydrolase domain-containing protein [Chitinophaga ginsengisoli]|uniref:CubicO group peptidase (Beta-lactamase class C family) n=1 Tax=Chitinophaga ginsengisoli TaxID=363837 RepID=A0A2P8FQY6_9BACT|nr:serine hydrolase domain-containing protein [Chitinophaga ginsengisoli]PSL24134.1 CubicO group peptidase (beta-lactamase class C family) [Chitinophaga ginsengisoli]
MKRYLLVILLLSCVQCIAQPLETSINQIFSRYNHSGVPGVAALVIQNGKVIFKKGYGTANLEYDAPITPATVFDIASVSKQFTGFAISTLIQEGKISPDDDIRKYLPEVPQFSYPITIRHLVHHTSGLRDWPATLHAAGWRWDEAFTFEDILRMVKLQHDLDFQPGARYSYSNTGYNLLAALVAKVSGKPFPQWIQEHVFTPLQMNASLVSDDYSKVIPRLASSYDNNDGKTFRKLNDALTALGSSSIFTTVEDLSKWVIHFQQQIDRKDPVFLRMLEIDSLNNKEPVTYGYGLSVETNNGIRNISHDGGWAGFRTTINVYPDQKLAIILLSNNSDFDPESNALAVAKLFLKDKLPAIPVREDLSKLPTLKGDPELLKKYTGTYKLGDGWYVTFTLEEGHMMVQADGESKFPTDIKSDTVLWVPAYQSSVTFRNITDKAAALKYRNIIAPRITPVRLDSALLVPYTGTYYSEELETAYKFTVQHGKLTAHHMRLGDFDFTPDRSVADRFSSNNGTINFLKADAGNITGFKLSNGRIKNIVFKKQE